MTDKDLFYQKTLETINNEISNDQIGFSKDINPLGTISIIGDKTIIRQNNLIIEMLILINQKLEHFKPNNIVSSSANNLSENIDKITLQLSKLGLGSTKTPRMGKNMFVWDKFN